MRLRKAFPGGRFSFICAQDTAGKMDRVIAFSDGRTISKERQGDDTLFVVEKT